MICRPLVNKLWGKRISNFFLLQEAAREREKERQKQIAWEAQHKSRKASGQKEWPTSAQNGSDWTAITESWAHQPIRKNFLKWLLIVVKYPEDFMQCRKELHWHCFTLSGHQMWYSEGFCVCVFLFRFFFSTYRYW